MRYQPNPRKPLNPARSPSLHPVALTWSGFPDDGVRVVLLTIVGWLVFGLIAGLIARALVPGRDDIGLLMTIVIGVVGSVVGGFLLGLFTGGFRGFHPTGLIGSIIGAIIVLVIYNKVTGRKRRLWRR